MLLNSSGQELYTIGVPWEKAKSLFSQSMSLPHQGIMHRSELFEKYGNYDEYFRICGDYELLLRNLMNADAIFFEDIIVSGMRMGGISSNPSNSSALLLEIRRAQIKNGLRWPSAIWVFLLVRTYMRKILWIVLGESKAKIMIDLGRKLIGLSAHRTKL